MVHGVDGGPGLHGGGPVQEAPAAAPHHLHQEDLQQHLGELLPHAHPGAPPEGDVLEAGGVPGGAAEEALRLEVVLVGEDLRHLVGVADAVDDVPAFGDLVALKEAQRQAELVL